MSYKEAIDKISTNNKKVKQKEYVPNGKYPVIDQGQDFIGGFTNDESKLLNCALPALVFGDHTKIVKLVNYNFVPGADGVKVVVPRFFFNAKLFEIFTKIIALKIPDKGYARHFQYIEKSEIPLPPLPEQRAIVSKIEQLFSDLDNGIENFKKAQEQLKIYRQVVLKKAFEGELTKKWREKQNDLPSAEELLQQIMEEREKHYQKQLDEWKLVAKNLKDIGGEGKKLTKPKKTKEFPPLTNDELMELLELPKKWEYIKFGTIFSFSPQNGLYKPSDIYGSGTPIIRIDDFYDGKLVRYNNFKQVQLTKGEVERYLLRKGQIIVNRVNSIDYLGKCGLVEKIENNVVFESNIMKISILEKIVSSKFITYYLSSYVGTKEIRKNAKHAVNQASINQNDVSMTNIPFCNIQEQHKIVQEIETRLSICDNMEETITESLQKAESLRQSILKKAFEGKLLNEKELEEVRTAPDWEPAEKLLERIKAEKTNIEVKNKGKK